MKMEWVPGRNGYDIPVRAAWAGEEQAVIPRTDYLYGAFGDADPAPARDHRRGF